MANSPARSISAGGNLFASVSNNAVSIWRADSFSSSPVSVLPAPEYLSISSAALSPCGDVLAILFGSSTEVFGSSTPLPTLVLCNPESCSPLFRLELPKEAETAREPLVWISGLSTFSLLIPLGDSRFVLLELFPGYNRLKSKRTLNLGSKYGRPVRMQPVTCGKSKSAMALTYENALAVYSLPKGELLIMKGNVSVLAIAKIVQTASGYAALGLIDNLSLCHVSRPTKHASRTKTGSLNVSPTGVQSVPSSLVWAFIGNRSCRAIAPVESITAQQVLEYTVCSAKSLIALVTDAGNVLFLNPFEGRGSLFEHRLPLECIQALKRVSIAFAIESLSQPHGTHLVLSHSIDVKEPRSHIPGHCIHVISVSTREMPLRPRNGVQISWPASPTDASTATTNSHCISSSCVSPTGQLPVNQTSVSILLKLPLKPSGIAPSAVAAVSVPLHLALKPPKPLIFTTQARAAKEISKQGRRRKTFCVHDGTARMSMGDGSPLRRIPLRLRVKPFNTSLSHQ